MIWGLGNWQGLNKLAMVLLMLEHGKKYYTQLTVHPILNRNRKRSYFYYFPIFDTDWEKIIFTYRMKTQMDLDGFVVFHFHFRTALFDWDFHFPRFLTVTFSTILHYIGHLGPIYNVPHLFSLF